MTYTVIARVHPVHAMDAEQRQMATDRWTKLTDLSQETTPTTAIYYSARKLILSLILPSHGG